MNRALKNSLKPVRNLILTMASNIAICSVLFFILEDGDEHGPLWPLYWAVTTATTTGYGDISPATAPGRIVAMWLMLTSLALFAVATAHMASAIIQDPHLFSDEEQEELLDDTEDCLTLLVGLYEHHGIEVPDSIEEKDEILQRLRGGEANA